MNYDDVHVWHASLAQPEEVVAELTRVLSQDEREQAERRLTGFHRSRFIVGRAIQRHILSRYTHIAAAVLAFEGSKYGKPHLSGPAAASGLTFNVSNSSNLTVCAIACGRAVGIDIEHIRPLEPAAMVAARLFSADERATLEATPVNERVGVFLRMWVRREARIKAVGGSVWGSPDNGWRSHSLYLGLDYVGALVVEEDGPLLLRHFDWMAESHMAESHIDSTPLATV